MHWVINWSVIFSWSHRLPSRASIISIWWLAIDLWGNCSFNSSLPAAPSPACARPSSTLSALPSDNIRVNNSFYVFPPPYFFDSVYCYEHVSSLFFWLLYCFLCSLSLYSFLLLLASSNSQIIYKYIYTHYKFY